MLYRGRGLVPRMIRAVTGSRWTHAAWVLSATEILESDWELFGQRGVQVETLDDYARGRRMFVRVNLPREKVELALHDAMARVGARYDFRLFWSLFCQWVRRTLGRKPGPADGRRRAWICSELVATPLYRASGFVFDLDTPLESVTPATIARALENGNVIEIKEDLDGQAD